MNHIKGTNGRTFCGVKATEKTEFVAINHMVKCERCLKRLLEHLPTAIDVVKKLRG